jgi:hypothetical protein
MSSNMRWDALVRSFPSLRAYAEATHLLTAPGLDEWAHDRGLGSGAMAAVKFVLGVWDHDGNWKVGRFDLFSAIRVWDSQHLAAFKAWAANPFQA